MPAFEPPNVHLGLPGFAPGVRDAIYGHVYRDPANELGGLLVGDRRTDGSVIVGAIEATGAVGDVTSLTFTQDAWAVMLAELDRLYPGAEILGWYHSHPGHGVFLSRHDLFIHHNFFPAAWQVAIVVDPQRHHEGLFMWRGEAVELAADAAVDPSWTAIAQLPAAEAGSAAPPETPEWELPPPDPASRAVEPALDDGPEPWLSLELDPEVDPRVLEIRRLRARRVAARERAAVARRRLQQRAFAGLALAAGVTAIAIRLF